MNADAMLLTLAAIALVAAARQAWRSRARGDAAWRLAALVAGQLALAATLYFLLKPPARPGVDGTLVVLTADAPRPPAGAGADHVALPEAPDAGGIARVPDLGTALRRNPGTRALRVVGAGLPARDRDAARGLRIVFDPAPLPRGVVALEAPSRVAAGRRFVVAGRVHDAADARLELLDPAGRRVDLQPVADDGRFALTAVAGPAGRVEWTLRRRDAQDAVVESIAVPVDIVAGAPLRVVTVAGGINPEQKYLRRWALDAGLGLRSQASVGGGIEIGAATPRLTVDGLRETDLVILDDRAWRALGDGGRAALRDAVRDGVGLLVRLTADPTAADRAVFAAWGFEVAPADVARGIELPGTDRADAATTTTSDGDGGTQVDAASRDRGAVPLTRRALALAAADGVPLLRDAGGDTLALWRAEGRGRVALWNLADSFRLQLAGRRAAYGSLWADAAGTLARPRGDARDGVPPAARVGERVVLCGIGEGAMLEGAEGESNPLVVDPASGARACAAAWPTVAGWTTLRDGGRTTTFPVRAVDEAPGLARAALRDATAALAAEARRGAQARTVPAVPGPRWPWLLAWLAVAGGVWWLERVASRAGAGAAATGRADRG